MTSIQQRITNCLWFDTQAEEAAIFYTSIFKNSSIGVITYYQTEGFEFHQKPEGSVMTVSFFLDGIEFLGLNGGTTFKFSEAMSLIINCETQEEVDHYWNALTEGGEEEPCGWLKDKYGVSWQVNPVELSEMIASADNKKVKRVTAALFQMKKMDLELLRKAFNG